MCVQSFCLVCRVGPWHAGRRCEEVQAERGDGDAADKVFAQFAAREKLKQCPKCQFWVERNNGCDAMTCRCGFVFCYQCGGCLSSSAKQANLASAKVRGPRATPTRPRRGGSDGSDPTG
mmetsp:Transcript_51346/g.120602  ORF Transcript_51346/g.120602 Transcript_51346/m.120602 type:complete len:119 (+) Transcript_51346:1029-1385(+)